MTLTLSVCVCVSHRKGEKQWTSCFQRQVKALREQESYLRQLEQTVVLMQDNHR